MTVGPSTWSGLVRGAARYGAPERSRSAAHAHSAPPPVGVTAGQGGVRAPSSGTSEEGASPARGGEKSANSHSRPRRLSRGRGFQALLSVSQWCHLVATPHIAAARHGLDTGQPALKGLAPPHPPLFPLPHAGTRTGPSGTVGASEKEPVLTRGARSLLLTEGGGTEQRTLVETAWGRGAAPGPLLLGTREKAELRGHPDRPGGPRGVLSWWPFRVGRG